MDKSFINILDFIQSDMLVYRDQQVSDLIMECANRMEKTPDFPVFRKMNQKWFYVGSHMLLSKLEIEKIPWHATESYPMDQLQFSNILTSLSKSEFILIEDSNHRPIGYISARYAFQQMYRSYQHLEAFFNTILKTTDASISGIDHTGKTVIWTTGAEQLFSVAQKDIIGKPITDFFPVEMLQVIKTLQTGEAVSRQQHQPRSGLFVLINSNPVHLEKEIIGAVVSEINITSQIHLNRELFKATSKVLHLQEEMAKLNPLVDPFLPIKGSSLAIKQTIDTIKKLASTQATALILGESGVGKELFAKAIHDVREEAGAPFIAINCGAIPSTLFESELFGYEKGAFSGADQRGRKGKIEMARGGTLFLDEIAEMPLDMQVKLLRVLEERCYFPVGGTRLLDADCRIIAATNLNLEHMVKQGKFREDLYYRLHVVTVEIPPLRERKEDILELIHVFINDFSSRYKRVIHEMPNEVMQDLLQYDWPGNVRELRNAVERLIVLSEDGVVKREYLPPSINRAKKSCPAFDNDFTPTALSLHEELEKHEKKAILDAIKFENGNKIAAAKRLGISRATLYNKLSKWQLS